MDKAALWICGLNAYERVVALFYNIHVLVRFCFLHQEKDHCPVVVGSFSVYCPANGFLTDAVHVLQVLVRGGSGMYLPLK